AHRVAVLVAGSILFEGTPDQLFADQATLERGHLVAPPLFELSRRLGQIDRSFPPVATMSGMIAELDRRVVRPRSVSAVGGRP
ncbi:MAG: hypothetical protein ACRDIY_04735, partial [Chloroflexota bacterium]